MKQIALLFFLVSFPLSAKILRYLVAPGHTIKISLEKACAMMGQKNVLLSDVVNAKLDCMGQQFALNKVCFKLRPNSAPIDLAQATYDKDSIICNFSNRVELKLECSAKNVHYCLTAKKTCQKIRPKIATELKLVRAFSLLNLNNKHVLNCFYSSDLNQLPFTQNMNLDNSDKAFEQYLRSL